MPAVLPNLVLHTALVVVFDAVYAFVVAAIDARFRVGHRCITVSRKILIPTSHINGQNRTQRAAAMITLTRMFSESSSQRVRASIASHVASAAISHIITGATRRAHPV